MKIFRLIGILFIGSTLFSCSNSDDELLPKEQEQNDQETYTISFDLGGEFISTSETPLSRVGEKLKKRIYGINVYYKEDNGTYKNYAYGLFDNIGDMNISLISGYKYKFECTLVEDGVDIVYFENSSNQSKYYAPFHRGILSNGVNNKVYQYSILNNKFEISTLFDTHLEGLQLGITSIRDSSNGGAEQYPRTDRFYGELTDYIPTANGTVNIDLKRTVFGVKFAVHPPVDGTLSVRNYELELDMAISTNDSMQETEAIYTFYRVYDCWKTDNYTNNFKIDLAWRRANGATQYFSESITVKRNIMTTVNIKVDGGSTDAAI